MLQRIRKKRAFRIIAVYLALNLLAEIVMPGVVFALTGGPSQPEVQSFEPVGTSEMVELFSGDYNYNIPLLDVGGYPINISYHSGIGMDQEASWVGLGWNINPGAITRNMRGVPDDFSGDAIVKNLNMKANKTYGFNTGIGAEVFGNKAQTVSLSLAYHIGMNFNNYTGVGFEQTFNAAYSLSKPGMGSLTGGLGITSGSEGLTITPSLSFSKKLSSMGNSDLKLGGSIGAPFNSRAGLKKLALGSSITQTEKFNYKNSKGKTMNGNLSTSAANGGASISFGTPSYIPQVTMPMRNTSINVSFKTGSTIFGLDGTFDLSGYYSEQRLEQTSVTSPAYGYLNTDLGIANSRSILDFNREKDGAYTMNTPNLPLTNHTYDVYAVAGQGIGGVYRPFRADFGAVSDPYAANSNASASVGLELAGGNLLHGGVDVSTTNVTTASGKWTSENNTESALSFTKSVSGDPLYESYYFKEAGEKAVDSDANFFASIGDVDPVRVELSNAGGGKVFAQNSFKKDNGSSITISGSTNHRAARQKRNQAITLLTKTEAIALGLQSDMYSGTNNLLSSGAKAHHIAEITTLRTDGSRYVFGLPAYNTKQVEVTFNASGRSNSSSTGLVSYNPSGVTTDNTTSNTLGIDNYFSSTELPAYAHSYLLTAVLSPDYVDHDNIVGPSEGDLGTYTKFNYTKLNNEITSVFKWRVPVGSNTANFNEGLKTNPNDDQGNYIYGEKEIWYLQSIETKNYKATFTTENRSDGFGVTDENGTTTAGVTNGLAQKLLRKITLASVKDPNVIIKQVNFEYDYTLCTGLPTTVGGTGGKLTLKKIFFTYGTSNKAALSPYVFTYSSGSSNPAYSLKGYDRWGNYKPNDTNLPNSEFPYVTQDQTQADINAAAWSLKTIDLPSGGSINIDYESDDYAYVQDKQAMQMFKITGIDNGGGVTGTVPTTGLLMNGTTSNYYLYFPLQNPITAATINDADEILKNDYLKGINDLYFRFLVNLTGGTPNAGSNYEYVSGYASIDGDNYGVAATNAGSPYQYGWIKLLGVQTGDVVNSTDVNPVSLAACQFGRLHNPRLVYDQPTDPQGTSVADVLNAMANSGFAKNIKALFEGANGEILNKGYCKTAAIGKSWIRLLNPTKKKFGGGARVKKVSISDKWSTMVSGKPDAEYGQVYDYTMKEDNKTISSGVASYEPGLGGDENPFKTPKYFGAKAKLLVPSEEHFMEEPFGESFFPSPGVGYSKVTVKNLQYSTVKRNATGSVVHEFYTARDFPVITKQTQMVSMPFRTSPLLTLLKVAMKDYITASQGYVIELNDMHGKAKSQRVYAEGQATPISEVSYFYKTNPANPKQLANDVTTIKKTGEIVTANCGLDYDMAVDMRQQQTINRTFGLNANISAFLAGLLPGMVPTIFPNANEEHTRFRSAVTTKVINRYGILQKTVAMDLGSTVATENLAFDWQTGEVLATKTINGFNDPIFSMTYPAHWAYTGMSQAYQNVGAKFDGVAFSSGSATLTNGANVFIKGDEVSYTNSSGTILKAWVCSVTNSGANATISLIKKDGNFITDGNYNLRIVRSARRNQQVVNVGTFTSRLNPLIDYGTVNTLITPTPKTNISQSPFVDILNASSAEFSDTHKTLSSAFTASPVGSGGGVCNTSEATDLGNMLNTLAFNGQLLNTEGAALYSSEGETYYYGFTALLKSNTNLTSLTSVNWFASLSGNVLTGRISNTTSGGCTVTLTLPSGYSWSDVVGFRNIVGSGGGGNFGIDVIVNTTGGVVIIPIINATNSCFTLSSTQCGGGSGSCSLETSNTINPYFEGIRGTWRPLKSYLYLSDRTQNSGPNSTFAPRKDGSFFTIGSSGFTVDFQTFWNANSGNDWTKDAAYWTSTSEVTKYNPIGVELENKDALGRFSSALYGYNHSLPIAVAANSKYNQLAYDGFEDYAYGSGFACVSHFDFKENNASRTSTQAHSGLYSIKVEAGQSLMASRPLMTAAPATGADNCPYTLKASDDIGVFSPDTYNGDKKYVLSVWVKQDATTAITTYTNAAVAITVGTTAIVPASIIKTDIIDGWQKQELTFTITSGATGNILVYLINSGTQAAYFDDIRIHPFDGNMKSFVYNPKSLRLMAELDNNNYATFYEYDEEGALVRVKKETQSGIATIKESKNNTHKQ